MSVLFQTSSNQSSTVHRLVT